MLSRVALQSENFVIGALGRAAEDDMAAAVPKEITTLPGGSLVELVRLCRPRAHDAHSFARGQPFDARVVGPGCGIRFPGVATPRRAFQAPDSETPHYWSGRTQRRPPLPHLCSFSHRR